jgi:hypothetical protein
MVFGETIKNKITEVTRRYIIDYISLSKISWSGRLQEPDFLARIFPLHKLPSNDYRYKDAYGDIWQHRVNNFDLEDDWVFTDSRFNILNGSDDNFFKFLCETVHPVVQPDSEKVTLLVNDYNKFLRHDGWELYPASFVSGKPIYNARIIGEQQAIETEDFMTSIDKSYVSQQIKRMNDALRLSDTEQAIGTAKEFVETICKYALSELEVETNDNEDIPTLVKMTCKELNLVPESVPDSIGGKDKVRRLLMNVASIGQSCAELRNIWGTGHGKSADFELPYPRLARLAVNSAITLGMFLFETLQDQYPSTCAREYINHGVDLRLEIEDDESIIENGGK